MGFEHVAFHYASFELPNACLVLREFEEPVPWRGAVDINDNGNVHVCLEVNDLNVTLRRLLAAGITTNGPAARAPEPHERSSTDWVLFLNGPDGEHVELVGPIDGRAQD